jgi:hypothetical protein
MKVGIQVDHLQGLFRRIKVIHHQFNTMFHLFALLPLLDMEDLMTVQVRRIPHLEDTKEEIRHFMVPEA